MTYVDGFVLAVPTANKAAFVKLAKDMVPWFKKHGALRVVENWGADVPDGEVTSFPMAVQCGPDETVVFSWIVWPSKEVRDAGMEKITSDPAMQPDPDTIPFDAKRMIFGGFETVVDE